jgi:cytochrome c-type biogenesis protein CcsB
MESSKSRPIDNNIMELHGALTAMEGVFTGLSMKVVPVQDTQGFRWLSLQELADRGQDESIRGSLQGLMTAFVEKKPEEFNRHASELTANLHQQAAEYSPSIDLLEKERFYNSFKPFRKSWMFLLVAAILFGVSMGLSSGTVYLSAWVFYAIGFAMSSTALILRVMISGRPPVSNMYESLVYMGWGVILFAGVFEVIHKRRIFGFCGSAMGVLVLILADMLPFDPGISPLVPVLRSNYWLLVHVMTIVISYSAFALATTIAHFSLCAYLFSPRRKDLIETANNFVYRSIQVGVLLLTAGTILGGVWANESWGRFWGWDPKETWSLISLVGYFALLHARFWGVIRGFGTAVCAILGFQLILMTWYGVNFILATGLHSYGFGSGGLGYLVAYEVAEAAFLALVAIRYKVVYPTLLVPVNQVVQTGSVSEK